MKYINIEIKARTKNQVAIRAFLTANGADFKGIDAQTDTYFEVPNGRLKLREGNIENNLIAYNRKNEAGPKQSNFSLAAIADPAALKSVLQQALPLKVVVRKRREIYYIDNVKFHIDEVDGLGAFVEIEAGNKIVDLPVEKLRAQCDYYIDKFRIAQSDLIDRSYSDMLLEKANQSSE